MIAFVFTGGGSRGPLQAGAIRALLESNIQPDFVVGTSAGALNATFLAAWGPSMETAHRLGDVWLSAGKSSVMPGGVLGAIWRVIRREKSLFSSQGLRAMMETHLPPTARTYGDLVIPCYVTTADLRTRSLYLFGEDPTAPIIEAALASATIPVVYPPVDYYGSQLVDGGVVDNVPATIAMDKGATTIYLVNVGYSGDEVDDPAKSLFSILDRTLGTFLAHSLFDDLARGEQDPTIDLHHIVLETEKKAGKLDLTYAAEWLESGYRKTLAYLQNPAPRSADPALSPYDVAAPTLPGARLLPRRYP